MACISPGTNKFRMGLFLVVAGIALSAPTPVAAQRAAFEEIQTFSSVLNLIRLNHVDSVSYTPLVRAAIEGALGAADPHSRYVRRDVESTLIAARSGELGTAGMELDGLRGVVRVVSVGVGSPAEKAGLLPGDRIVAVQDSGTEGLAAHEVELLLAARPGTDRRVAVERGDAMAPQRLDLRVKLEKYTWPNVVVATMVGGDVGYVRLGVFDTRAGAETERALDGLARRGMKRLILDLRGNPGGLLTEAVSVATLFLPKDAVVMTTRGRKSDTNSEYRTRGSGDYRTLPMVVLVDGSSASAAEALAGALQDHERARIVGHRTFGKALVQAPFPLPAGDVLWLTIARVHTPKGRMIQRSYDGLTVEQYGAAAEQLRRGGASAAAAGSGGIEPDIYFDARPEAPRWWADVRRRSLDLAAVQRASLNGDDHGAWEEPLLAALRSVLGDELGAMPALEPDQERGVARALTIAALRARTGEAAAAEHAARTDPEVLRAMRLLDESQGPR